jgi:hypothetical protein
MKTSFRALLLASFAASCACLVLAGCHSGGNVPGGPYVALGEMTAKATADMLGGRGKLAIVVGETDKNTDTSLGQALKSFTGALKSSSGITVTSTETVPVPATLAPGVEPLTAEQFIELVQKHAGDDVLVSFVGVPRLTRDQIAQLPTPRPKVVAAMNYNPPSKLLFEQGVLCFAVIPQPAEDSSGSPPKTTAELFRAHFRFVSPSSAATLPN